MNIRIRFEKYGSMKYLGHLDLMRYFQKALRRAQFPLEFSKGFHPHPIIAFAQPLSVGVTSACEYFDVSLCSDVDASWALDNLNAQLGEGVGVLDVEILPEKSKNAMSLVSAAEYIVYFKDKSSQLPEHILNDGINKLLSKEEILFKKKTKKSEITKDIKPFIYSIKTVLIPLEDRYEISDGPAIFMHIKSGSEDNLTPVPIALMVLNEAGVEFSEENLGVHRNKLYLG